MCNCRLLFHILHLRMESTDVQCRVHYRCKSSHSPSIISYFSGLPWTTSCDNRNRYLRLHVLPSEFWLHAEFLSLFIVPSRYHSTFTWFSNASLLQLVALDVRIDSLDLRMYPPHFFFENTFPSTATACVMAIPLGKTGLQSFYQNWPRHVMMTVICEFRVDHSNSNSFQWHSSPLPSFASTFIDFENRKRNRRWKWVANISYDILTVSVPLSDRSSRHRMQSTSGDSWSCHHHLDASWKLSRIRFHSMRRNKLWNFNCANIFSDDHQLKLSIIRRAVESLDIRLHSHFLHSLLSFASFNLRFGKTFSRTGQTCNESVSNNCCTSIDSHYCLRLLG